MPQKRGDFRRNHLLSAQDETRTHTILRPLPPQSSVYTNFTTCARVRHRTLAVPRTGLEPARLATYAPETYASTNSATWARRNSLATRFVVCTTKMSPRLLLFEKPLFAQCFFEGLQRTLSMNFVPLEKVSRTSVLLISLGERQTRLELATPTLARSCSTN